MRVIAGIVVAVTIGAVAGALVTQGHLKSQVLELSDVVGQLQGELEETSAALNAEVQRKRFLEQENEALYDQVDALEHIALMASSQSVANGASELDEVEFDGAVEGESVQADAAIQARRERGEERTDEEREERRRAAREQWAERGANMQDRVRARMDDFFEREMQAASDHASRERVAMMQDYTNYLAEIGEQMRQAGSRDERRALGQEMREAFGNMQQLMTDQQDSMMRDVAERYGITNPAQQAEFIEQVRGLQSSPFFRPERIMMGGPGGGGRGGGPGGGFPGGGPPQGGR